MMTLKTTVKYKVPVGMYCYYECNKKSPRCRFCVEHKKGIFICVLHNEPLAVEQGYLAIKTTGCMKGVSSIE